MLSRYLPGETKENHEKLRPERQVRFEKRTSQRHVRKVTGSPACLVLGLLKGFTAVVGSSPNWVRWSSTVLDRCQNFIQFSSNHSQRAKATSGILNFHSIADNLW